MILHELFQHQLNPSAYSRGWFSLGATAIQMNGPRLGSARDAVPRGLVRVPSLLLRCLKAGSKYRACRLAELLVARNQQKHRIAPAQDCHCLRLDLRTKARGRRPCLRHSSQADRCMYGTPCPGNEHGRTARCSGESWPHFSTSGLRFVQVRIACLKSVSRGRDDLRP
jgi:hypothetical protein